MGDSGIPSAFTKPDTPTYPPLPSIFDVSREPYDLITVWAHAQAHIWIIGVYLDGLDRYIHPPELTTGHGPLCSTAWGESCDEMPGCPVDLTGYHLPLLPCTCRYFHQRTRMVIHEGRNPHSIFLVVGTGFAIDRDCLHHGDAALVYPIGEPVDPRFWETLDELERGNR